MAYTYGGKTYSNFAGAVAAATASPGGGRISAASGGSVASSAPAPAQTSAPSFQTAKQLSDYEKARVAANKASTVAKESQYDIPGGTTSEGFSIINYQTSGKPFPGGGYNKNTAMQYLQAGQNASDIMYDSNTGDYRLKPTAQPVSLQQKTQAPAPVEVKKATLYGPNNEPTVVNVGSQQASDLQSKGYGLTSGSYVAPQQTTKKPVPVETTNLVTESPLAPERQDATGPVDLASLEPSTDANVLAARKRIEVDQSRGQETPQEILDMAELDIPGTQTMDAKDAVEDVQPLKLTPEQELDIAAKRIFDDTASDLDRKNVDYAEQHLGYERPEEYEEGVDPVTRAAVKNLEDNGITTPDSSQDPAKTYADTYQSIYEDLGLTDFKTQMKETTNAINDMENEKDDEIRDINDNPWLTEGVRLRRIAKVEEKYEDKLGNLYNKFRLEESTFNSGVQQAQFVASQALKLNMWQQEFDLQTKNSLAKQAQDSADALNDKETKVVQGGLYDITNNQWIIPPKGTGGNTVTTPEYLNRNYLKDNYTTEELKAFADKTGQSKFYTGTEKDVERFLNYFEGRIIEARLAGYSDDEILAFITE